jgi:hypothetical protein
MYLPVLQLSSTCLLQKGKEEGQGEGEGRQFCINLIGSPPHGGPGTIPVPKSTVCGGTTVLYSTVLSYQWPSTVLPLCAAAGGLVCSLTGRCFRRPAAGEAKEEAGEKVRMHG